MKKTYLLMGVAILLLLGSGCAKLPVELGSASEVAAQAAEIVRSFTGSGSASSLDVSGLATAYSFEVTDDDGWFSETGFDEVTETTATFKMRFTLNSSIDPYTGTLVNLGAAMLSSDKIVAIEISFSALNSDGNSCSASFTITDVDTDTPSVSGTATATVDGQPATITFTGMTADAAGNISLSAVSATYMDYQIDLTVDDDGSVTGTIKEADVKIADIAIAADGSGTITHEGTVYDINTGEPV